VAFDEELATRVRKLLWPHWRLTERPMFGGLTFLLRGHMCCGVIRDRLVVRVGPARYDEVLTQSHARPMDFTGRPLRGMVYVMPAGCRTDAALRRWVTRALDFVETLPPKAGARGSRTSGPPPGRKRGRAL